MNPTRGHGKLEHLLSLLRYYKARQLLEVAHHGGRLLDVGCGSYPLSLERMPFLEKHGVDQVLEPELVEQMRKRNLRLHQADFTQGLPFPDSSFDAVMMLASIEHIDRPEEVVKEVARVLRGGGYFVLTTPSFWTGPILTLLAYIGLISKEELEEHRDLLGPGLLKNMLLEADFPPEGIEHGYFELGLNQWVRARR